MRLHRHGECGDIWSTHSTGSREPRQQCNRSTFGNQSLSPAIMALPNKLIIETSRELTGIQLARSKGVIYPTTLSNKYELGLSTAGAAMAILIGMALSYFDR